MDKKVKEYHDEIIEKMESVGTYDKSFSYTINVLAKVMADYDKTIETFEKTGGNIVVHHTNKSGSTNLAKNPLYLALEKLRDDIISYSRELGLTPAGLQRLGIKDKGKPSVLAKLLQDLDDNGKK